MSLPPANYRGWKRRTLVCTSLPQGSSDSEHHPARGWGDASPSQNAARCRGGRGWVLDPVEAWSSPEARVAGAGGGVPACLGRTAVQQEAGKGSGRRCFPWEEDAFQARLHDARLGADLTPLEDLGAVLSLSATRPRGMLPQCPLLSGLLIAFHSGYTACRCARPHACAFGCVVGVRVSGQYTGPPPPSAQSPESATCNLLCSHSAHLQQLRED